MNGKKREGGKGKEDGENVEWERRGEEGGWVKGEGEREGKKVKCFQCFV